MRGMPERPDPALFEQLGDVVMLAHLGHTVIRHHEYRRQFSSLLAEAFDECTQRPIDQPIALDDRRVERILKMGDPIDPGEYDKEETPGIRRRGDPGTGDGPIQRPVSPQVVGRGPEDGAPERDAVGTWAEAPRDGRTDRDTVRHEIEERRSRSEIVVQPASLHAAIAARRAPLLAPSLPGRRAVAIEPTDARNPHAPGIAAEQEGDVRHPRRRWEHRRSSREAAALDHPAREVRQIAALQEVAQHVGAGAIDQDEDCSHRTHAVAESTTRKRPRHLPGPPDCDSANATTRP